LHFEDEKEKYSLVDDVPCENQRCLKPRCQSILVVETVHHQSEGKDDKLGQQDKVT